MDSVLSAKILPDLSPHSWGFPTLVDKFFSRSSALPVCPRLFLSTRSHLVKPKLMTPPFTEKLYLRWKKHDA